MPTRASGTIESPATLARSTSWSMASCVVTTTSKASPVRIRCMMPPDVSIDSATLWPLCFSKAGIISSAIGRKAAVVMNLTVSAQGLADACQREAQQEGKTEQEGSHCGVPIT